MRGVHHSLKLRGQIAFLAILLLGPVAFAQQDYSQSAPVSANVIKPGWHIRREDQVSFVRAEDLLAGEAEPNRGHAAITTEAEPVAPQAVGFSAMPLGGNEFEARHVPEQSLSNSQRINGLLRNGKLMLSLDDAIALAIESNLDLVIARYKLPIADTDLLRAKSGASTRGVTTGIVQGTPGGGAGAIGNTGANGGGAGGTSAAAGGAGTGIGELAGSTLGVGPPLDSYDPVVSANQNTATRNLSYVQGFATGTQLSVAADNSTASYQVQLRQHLLQGLSLPANRRFMVIARNNREMADVAFRQQVIFTVTQIENLYWNLVSAGEEVQAKQRALELAQQLESNNRKQVQAGTMASIDIVNAEAQVASSRQALIVSQTNFQLQQVLMRNALTRNESDSVLEAAEVVPTDRMEVPANEPVVPTQELINEALHHRPELAQARIDLANRQISKAAARNASLPTVDFVANYGGGSTVPGGTNSFFGGGSLPIGLTKAFLGMNVGFNVSIPIRNRPARADQVRSELEYRQAQARLQQLQDNIAVDVRNAQFAVQQNRALVEAARAARDYQSQSLIAEQKRLAHGSSTTYNVLQTMANLATAESNLVNAMTAYEQSRVQLEVVSGTTLNNLGIDIADAESGRVTHMPHVPGVTPAGKASSTINSLSAQPAQSRTPQTQTPPAGSL